MSTEKNIQIVSFWFFLVFGLAQIILGLFIFNGHYSPNFDNLFRVLDIPFAFSGIVYLFSSLALRSYSNARNNLYLFSAILLFVVVLFLNLYYADLPLPLTYGN